MEKFFVRHAQSQEFAVIADLVARVFYAGDDYQRAMHQWVFSRPRAPNFDYAAHRVGVLVNDASEKVVSHTAVFPHTLRYGSVALAVSGVGFVCTHPDFRRNGYNSAVMHDSLAYMAEQGTHLALLNGINHFGARFGFSPVFPDYCFEADSTLAANLPKPLHLRPPTPDDIPYMAALYQKHWSARVTFTRSAELWLWRVAESSRPFMQVVEDGHGYICGYIAAQHEMDEGAEVVVDSMEAALTLLADMGERFRRAGIARISWLLPPDDALVYYARQVLPVRVSALYQPYSGWTARIINTEALIDALLPELIAQARTILPDVTPRNLEFFCQPDAVEVGLRGKPETCSRISHEDFIQVVFGSLRPAMLALRSSMSQEAVRLLEALFPPRMASLAGWDWF
jgi:predicted acetyltransferase